MNDELNQEKHAYDFFGRVEGLTDSQRDELNDLLTDFVRLCGGSYTVTFLNSEPDDE